MMKPGTSHFDNHSRRISIRQQRSVRHSHRPLCWLLVFLLSVWVLSLVSKPEAQTLQVRSDQMSHSVVSNSLRPHESQHARPPCPSPTPGDQILLLLPVTSTTGYCFCFGCFPSFFLELFLHWSQLNYPFLFAKLRFKLNKVRKTTRPFGYDLNHIPYHYTVEVTNRFKVWDLELDRVPDKLWTEICNIE